MSRSPRINNQLRREISLLMNVGFFKTKTIKLITKNFCSAERLKKSKLSVIVAGHMREGGSSV